MLTDLCGNPYPTQRLQCPTNCLPFVPHGRSYRFNFLTIIWTGESSAEPESVVREAIYKISHQTWKQPQMQFDEIYRLKTPDCRRNTLTMQRNILTLHIVVEMKQIFMIFIANPQSTMCEGAMPWRAILSEPEII